MRNNYILCKMDNKYCINVELDTELSLHNIHINATAKIDTGCAKTSIPLSNNRFMLTKDIINDLKLNAINTGLEPALSFGVSDSSNIKSEERKLFRSNNFMECSCVSFEHSVPYFKLNGYDIPTSTVRVNYNRENNILIGMDVLQLLDFHCGYSEVLNNFIFIGVLKSQEDKSDYYRELEKHFGIVTSCKDLLYYDFLEDEKRKNEASGFFNWLTRKFGGNNEKDK